jgi:hypothetical protein
LTLTVLLGAALALAPNRAGAQDDAAQSNEGGDGEAVSRGASLVPSRTGIDLRPGAVSAGRIGFAVSFPDVCKTPAPPAPPVPLPYPNIGANVSALGEGTHKVRGGGEIVVRKASTIADSSGNAPGAASGGIVTARSSGRVAYSIGVGMVKVDGKNLPIALDTSLHNDDASGRVSRQPTPSREAATSGAAPAGAEEGRIVELEDGRICGVCMRSNLITAIYELERTSVRR